MSALQSAIATYVGNNGGEIPRLVVAARTEATELTAAVDSIDFSFYNAVAIGNPAVPVPVEKTIYADTRVDYPLDNYCYSRLCALYTRRCLSVCSSNCSSDKTTQLSADVANLVDDGTARSYAIVYALEGDPNWQCVDNV